MSHNSCECKQTVVLWVSVSDFKQLNNMKNNAYTIFSFYKKIFYKNIDG